MLVYATPADLDTWLGEPGPDNATSLLRRASILVASATSNDVYDTQPNGLPADDDLIEALRDATCAQAETWQASDADPVAGAGGQTPRLTTTAIDGANLSYDTYLTAPSRANALAALDSAALQILRLAGLGSAGVISW